MTEPADKRQNFRLLTKAKLFFYLDGVKKHAHCYNFSQGGLLLVMPSPPSKGKTIHMDTIHFNDKEYLFLDIEAEVIWRGFSDTSDNLKIKPVGVGLKFIDLNPESTKRVNKAFNHLLENSITLRTIDSDGKNKDTASIKFPEEKQLAIICRTLLQRVGLDWIWTQAGPKDNVKELLRTNARLLPEDQRIVFLFVWGLWNEIMELPATQLERLEPELQDSIIRLSAALRQDSNAIDEWLALEEVSHKAIPGAAQ